LNFMIQRNQYLVDIGLNGKRLDERKADEFRKITIEKNPIEKAEGSALVKLGITQAIVGVKMEVKAPFPDTPNEGVLMVGCELSPLASPEYEKGPPTENSIEVARLVDRTIRESHAIDLEKLCITKGEKVWIVNVDIHVIDNGGNLVDAATLAAVTALMNAKMPKYEDDKVVIGEKTNKKVPLTCKPVSVTHIKIGENLFVDPTEDEESVATARLTVGSKDDGNICSLQKGGTEGLTMKELEHILEKSVEIGKQLRKHLKE